MGSRRVRRLLEQKTRLEEVAGRRDALSEESLAIENQGGPSPSSPTAIASGFEKEEPLVHPLSEGDATNKLAPGGPSSLLEKSVSLTEPVILRSSQYLNETLRTSQTTRTTPLAKLNMISLN